MTALEIAKETIRLGCDGLMARGFKPEQMIKMAEVVVKQSEALRKVDIILKSFTFLLGKNKAVEAWFTKYAELIGEEGK